MAAPVCEPSAAGADGRDPQGELSGRSCHFKRMLEIRFGLAASDPLAARLGAIGDMQCLKQLHRAAIQVLSLEAFSEPARRRRVGARP